MKFVGEFPPYAKRATYWKYYHYQLVLGPLPNFFFAPLGFFFLCIGMKEDVGMFYPIRQTFSSLYDQCQDYPISLG
jgi:hypothetical protein